MDRTEREPGEITRELEEFAKSHGLLLPNPDCVSAHANRFVSLGHCPCVTNRVACPCDEALTDIERWGRCECGILIDPVRLSMLKAERSKS